VQLLLCLHHVDTRDISDCSSVKGSSAFRVCAVRSNDDFCDSEALGVLVDRSLVSLVYLVLEYSSLLDARIR
jgi:hypothetical protein